jgi:hypothetical protein
MRLAAFVCHLKTTRSFSCWTTNLSAIRNVSHEALKGMGTCLASTLNMEREAASFLRLKVKSNIISLFVRYVSLSNF